MLHKTYKQNPIAFNVLTLKIHAVNDILKGDRIFGIQTDCSNLEIELITHYSWNPLKSYAIFVNRKDPSKNLIYIP